MLAAHAYTGNAAYEKAGGALGVITAFIAYYVGTASFLTKNTRWVMGEAACAICLFLTTFSPQLLYAPRR